MILIYQFFFLILTYFISAIPFGLILTKVFAKKDVRQFGSGNIGATNVARVVGKKLALVTLILDGLKGAVMVATARFVFHDTSDLHLFLVLIGAVAVLGHVYPVYLHFRGGKGVATTVAVLLALDFNVGFLAICFWIMSFCLFRISSISSMVAVFSSIILSSHYDAPTSQLVFCWFLFILILIRHKENILRLLTGEEQKF
ncbi:MAG: glycerol-3-phosphate 1-O-acyltransferase PlsY [Alphaproteobacteria bacterium]|nr:glycerol-3-phosphate 1-O-acyltransferase PlsY [Alphaproteobacteria bacterium]